MIAYLAGLFGTKPNASLTFNLNSKQLDLVNYWPSSAFELNDDLNSYEQK